MNLGPLQEQQVLLTLRHLSSPELHAFDEKCLAHVATDALGEVWQGGRVHVSLFHEVGHLDPAKSTCGRVRSFTVVDHRDSRHKAESRDGL